MENLKVKIEEVSSISKKLIVEIPYDRVKEEMQKAFDKISKNAVIKGFRKGNVPKSVIEKKYSDSVRYDVAEKLINESYSHVIKEHKIEAVGSPNISDISLKDNEPLVYEAIVEVRPTVEPKDYTGMELRALNPEPTDKEVKSVISSYLESKADMKPTAEDRPARVGDWVDIDLEGFIDGKKREDLTVKAYVCEIGDKRGLLEELSIGIQGMKVEENKEIKTKYPDDHHVEDLKGKDVVFKVKLNKILDRTIPELTDEMIKEDGTAQSKDEFRTNIRENLRIRKQEARDSELRTQVVDFLLEKNEFEVPSAEVERRLPEIKERAIRNMFGPKSAKLPEKDVKEMLGRHEDALSKAAEREVQLWYILSAIAKKENITVSIEEVQSEMEDMAKSLNLDIAKLKKQYGERNLEYGLTNTIIERKTFDYLYKHAKINERKEGV